jgi:hypothetical protein
MFIRDMYWRWNCLKAGLPALPFKSLAISLQPVSSAVHRFIRIMGKNDVELRSRSSVRDAEEDPQNGTVYRNSRIVFTISVALNPTRIDTTAMKVNPMVIKVLIAFECIETFSM